MTVRPATDADIPAILRLQQANLFANVPEAERGGGFVTTPYTPEQIREFLVHGLVFVAEAANGEIAGYVFAATWDRYMAWDFFRAMVARFPDLPTFLDTRITTENTFQYGPVCVAAAYRGQGILPQLFDAVRTAFAPRFAVGVTMINPWNQRSLDAHTRKLGLTILDSWEFGGRPGYTLAFPTRPGMLIAESP